MLQLNYIEKPITKFKRHIFMGVRNNVTLDSPVRIGEMKCLAEELLRPAFKEKKHYNLWPALIEWDNLENERQYASVEKIDE